MQNHNSDGAGVNHNSFAHGHGEPFLGQLAPEVDGAAGTDGSEAALDLIFGHLPNKQYIPVHRNTENQLNGWFRPNDPEWRPDDSYNIVLKIQPFKAGGYEANAKKLCLPDIAKMIDADRKTGKREKPEEVDEETRARSIKRSKTKFRHTIKSMGCDRLLTLTRRETEQEQFWSRGDWAKAWELFIKACKRANIPLEYVAVLEHHKKGNYHLHVALTGRVHVNTIRQIWWGLCGGRGQGNVDIRFRGDLPVHQRLAGLAKYLSKYLTKTFGKDELFNKKRYWSSKHALPDSVKIILKSDNVLDALKEVADYYALDFRALMSGKHAAFQFPDGNGFWFNYSEAIAGEIPF